MDNPLAEPSISGGGLQKRLLQDIDELCRKPYPNIELHVNGEDLTHLCLILSPIAREKLHLTIDGLNWFPLRSPRVRMDTNVVHPNVIGHYICASILNTAEGYTPAYTLKTIAIQLLSFFSSDNIEQSYPGEHVNLEEYRRNALRSGRDKWGPVRREDPFSCHKCHFGEAQVLAKREIPGATYVSNAPGKRSSRRKKTGVATQSSSAQSTNGSPSSGDSLSHPRIVELSRDLTMQISKIPNEILLIILKKIEDFEDLTNFARAWPRRELQCFVLKKSYREVDLGVGVHGNNEGISSEFDLLSHEAFLQHAIRHSVHRVYFDCWLPLPISRPHWRRVRLNAHQSLERMKAYQCIKFEQPTNAQVLYQFMTEIVIRLNNVEVDRRGRHNSKSTLRHASDKAIESYFHLFHLLVCLASEDITIVRTANRLLVRFQGGRRSKTDVPNLGHLLVAMLISDVEVTPELRKAIVTEAITRNVVWMLKSKPQLAYKEPDEVSAYRLNKTFEVSRTSYRLLMFSELFRRTARPNHEPLSVIREQLFDRHGGPPQGAASHVAAEVRRLHGVNDFTQFMREMGFAAVPTAASFTSFLRRTMDESVKEGYSKEPLSQALALALRLPFDPTVGVRPELRTIDESVAIYLVDIVGALKEANALLFLTWPEAEKLPRYV
ncbi:hypothetical protein BKA67DRAFT_595447 [Truncatella angustata]|uniref:UBC core domain-containing protein n=1 Tax=Truncatella angustata TaxID=152316 RepID=A0A9P8RHK3_9PEZI|nr:uncharacterized protein BKA67DRAFT_595447 [Truncatella angustata]KAH6645987.1 hypothetical protein BKA67DRAFT_595447 [Truncatella angustata]